MSGTHFCALRACGAQISKISNISFPMSYPTHLQTPLSKRLPGLKTTIINILLDDIKDFQKFLEISKKSKWFTNPRYGVPPMYHQTAVSVEDIWWMIGFVRLNDDLILLSSVSVIVLDVRIILDLGPRGVPFIVMLVWVDNVGDWYAMIVENPLRLVIRQGPEKIKVCRMASRV